MKKVTFYEIDGIFYRINECNDLDIVLPFKRLSRSVNLIAEYDDGTEEERNIIDKCRADGEDDEMILDSLNEIGFLDQVKEHLLSNALREVMDFE